MATPLPDWRLPLGVSRGLWDYLHDPDIAQNYDTTLAGTVLIQADQQFAERHFDRPGRLIDLGCGTGRLLIPFAQRGHWVLGVDLSDEMLKQAAERATQVGAAVNLLKANLVVLDCLHAQSFDYAACLFSTLGMICGTANRQRVLEHVYRLLRPGGKFVLHVHNRWFNIWDPEGRRWLARDLLRSLLLRSERGDRQMPVHQRIAGLTLHLFTLREVKRMLKSAGFKIVEVAPVGLQPVGLMSSPRLFPRLRTYGYLLAALRP